MSTPDAAELHRRGVHDGDRGRYGSARRLLRRALERAPDPELRAHILLSLSYYEAERSHLEDGLRLLDEAAAGPALPERLQGLLAGQRGLLYQRAGMAAQSLAALDAAARLLGEDDPEERARVLLNRGILHLDRGARSPAAADFTACRGLARRHHLDLMAAKAAHNLGYVCFLTGDLPRALREMDAVAPQLGHQSPMFAAVYYSDRALVLHAAGLFHEADEDLEKAADLFRAAGVGLERATAELTRARVALDQHRWIAARRLARRAQRRFRARGSTGWTLLAELICLAADVGAGVRSSATARAASGLQRDLACLGLTEDARRAALIGAAAALQRGDPRLARRIAGSALRMRRDDSLQMRLQARTIRVDLALAEGRHAAAGADLRAALKDLHHYQASFGSWDLQTAVSAHGRPLAERALSRALADGRPATVFAWSERARALSARIPPVVPPDDQVAAALLEDLRVARVQLHGVDPGDASARDLRARCRRLERLIRERWWYTPGRGEFVEPVDLTAVRARLAADGACLVAHLIADGRLHALVVGPHHEKLLTLGDASMALELRQRARADLDTLAVLPSGSSLRHTVAAAQRATLDQLDHLLWGSVRGLIGDERLLLAPTAELLALPWTLLPSLLGRPVSVVPSVAGWLTAAHLAHPEPPFATGRPLRVVAASGPGLARGPEEVQEVTSRWPSAHGLPAATPTVVMRVAGVADVLHVAAHGVHTTGNALFSHLHLHGGALFGHELQHLPRLPAHVVLSACELGLVDVRSGGEPLGMAASLLHAGVRSVVAGVARVSDTAACRLAIAHHERLSRGLAPADALAASVAELTVDDPAPFVCFGAGW
ncbi:MAG TPA: CHAT domain-containing protein [Kineosporiaceae bacterium]